MHAFHKGCSVPPEKGGGGGEEEAPTASTVRGAPQDGDGPAEADVALMCPMALPHHIKREATKSPEQSSLETATIRSKICAVSTLAIPELTDARGKKLTKSCMLATPRSARFLVKKRRCSALENT